MGLDPPTLVTPCKHVGSWWGQSRQHHWCRAGAKQQSSECLCVCWARSVCHVAVGWGGVSPARTQLPGTGCSDAGLVRWVGGRTQAVEIFFARCARAVI